ncbi:MAG TPA: ribosome small subunit-dependent GTPase A [Clostridia bacterium]|nr:ribosome small subunit-dependent GTPase A [Clostridia bacterium]
MTITTIKQKKFISKFCGGKIFINGRVIKGVGGVFEVLTDEGKFICFPRKRLRHNEQDILIGDQVSIQKISRGKGSIEEVLPRKNRMKRPIVANVDQVFIVTAPMPPADFSLVDKILLNCKTQNISAILVINKCEAASEHFFNRVNCNYNGLTDGIITVSAHKLIGIDKLNELLSGKTTCFAGQSGVGKTSLLNVILPEHKGEIGAISAKIQRGKNTTRHSQLFCFDDGFIVDTPGFSLLELNDIKSDKLSTYYDDFALYANKCKYKNCTHTAEPNCAVKKAVENGEICAERYERYLDVYKEILEAEKNKY